MGDSGRTKRLLSYTRGYTRRYVTMAESGTISDHFILKGINPTERGDIGRGAYGRVFEVDYQGTLCAAKEVHALLLQFSQGDELRKIKTDFWSTIHHPNIVQFLGNLNEKPCVQTYC